MEIDAWWFENKQKDSEILQPEFCTPKTHLGIYAEMSEITFPFNISVSAKKDNCKIYCGEFKIDQKKEITDFFEIMCDNRAFLFKSIIGDVTGLPDEITVGITIGEKRYKKTVKCEYADIHGKITDFEGNPYPAVVRFSRISFDSEYACMAVWSDKNGEYSVIVPKGCYNMFYVCDGSYGKTVLESWSWHMIVDRDEEHDFKIGNGEVYSLSAWCNNGGGKTMFFWFRPMILPSVKKSEYETEINGIKRKVYDISPELELCDINVMLNGSRLNTISLQKIYETGKDYTMPSYIIQTERPDNASETIEKQTVIVEYNNSDRKEQASYTCQSQGRTQFYFKDFFALTLR